MNAVGLVEVDELLRGDGEVQRQLKRHRATLAGGGIEGSIDLADVAGLADGGIIGVLNKLPGHGIKDELISHTKEVTTLKVNCGR